MSTSFQGKPLALAGRHHSSKGKPDVSHYDRLVTLEEEIAHLEIERDQLIIKMADIRRSGKVALPEDFEAAENIKKTLEKKRTLYYLLLRAAKNRYISLYDIPEERRTDGTHIAEQV